MAIVFISPKQRQKQFFIGITIAFVLFLLIITSLVFLAKPKAVAPELVFNRPKIDINLQILDSELVKNLEPVVQMDLQFRYSATTNKGVKTSGIITAVSKEEAMKILQAMQLSSIVIKKANIGRENPFTPYYSPSGAALIEEIEESENIEDEVEVIEDEVIEDEVIEEPITTEEEIYNSFPEDETLFSEFPLEGD